MTIKRNDEIDLLDLLVRFLKFLKESFWFLTMLFFIGAFLGFLKVKISKLYYETTISAVSSANIDLTIGIINGIQNKLENMDEVSEDFSIADIEEIVASKNEENDNNVIRISVQYYNLFNIDSLTYFIKNYVEKNPYMMKNIELVKKQQYELITKIETEITELDSLQAITLRRKLNDQSQVLFINENNNTYQEILSLFDKKNEIERSFNSQGLRIIDNTEPIDSDKKYLLISILIGGLVLSFIGFIFQLMKKINTKYLTS